MTLARKLLIGLMLPLLLGFAGAFAISARNGLLYVEEQLAQQRADALGSLAAALSQAVTNDDRAALQRLIDAEFAKGDWQWVRVEKQDGRPLIERRLSSRLEGGAPAWLIEWLIPLASQAEAAVMSERQQTGVVKARSHSGAAYARWWRDLGVLLRWYLLSALLTLLCSMLLLRWLLRPLRMVEWQADSICQRGFPLNETLPGTQDLRRIVEAMNRLSTRVKVMLQESEQLALGLRRQAYQHPVTGLSNRRHFNNTLANLIDSSEEFATGVLALVQLRDFKRYNDKNGTFSGDGLLVDTARLLAECASTIPHHLLAHLGGAHFALLAPDYTLLQGPEMGARICTALSALAGKCTLQESYPAYIGLAYYDGTGSAAELLCKADMALQAAKSAGPGCWKLSGPKGEEAVRCASEWRAFIEHSLAMNRLRLQTQPVLGFPGRKLLHREVLVRLVEEESNGVERLLTAGSFMAQAERAGLSAEVDRAVISLVLQRRVQQEEVQYAINLSPFSLRTPGFFGWLEQQLRVNQMVAERLIFEMSEQGALTMAREVQSLVRMLERYGSRFSLDHFGRGFGSFTTLQSLRPHYLKLDGSYMRSLGEGKECQFFLQSLTKIAHGLDIQVIIESVESQVQWDRLSTLNADAAQGYFLGRPE